MISCGIEKGDKMKAIKNYMLNGQIPSEQEINKCIQIANTEDCIVRLEWHFPYSRFYSINITKDMTCQDVQDKMPRNYPV